MMLRLWLLVILLSVIPIETIIVQKGGNLLTGNYRQNLCNVAKQIYNGTIDPYYALQGLTINVAVNPDAPPFSFLFDSTNGGQPYDGFLYYIMMEMANRGGFKVNWVVTAAYNSFSSGTQYMQSYLPYVDVYGNVASDTVPRRALGIGFTSRVNDVSVILVALQSAAPSIFNVWNFLTPFTPLVWLAAFGVVVSNGVFRFLLSRWETYVDHLAHNGLLQWADAGADTSIFRFIFMSFGDFVKIPTEGMVRPKTAAAMLLKFGYTFFVLIMLASYTANLTNVFLTGKTPQFNVVSMDSANTNGQRICTLSSNSVATTVLATYPNVQVISITATSDPQGTLLRALKAGQCDGAMMYLTDWLSVQRVAIDNPACDIVQVGTTLRPNDGSYAFDLDYNTKCTAIIEPVFSSLLNSIVADGVYDEYFDYRVSQTSGIWCPAFDTTLKPSQITFQLVAGVFIMYGFMCMFAFSFLGISMTVSYVKSQHKKPVDNADTGNELQEHAPQATMYHDDTPATDQITSQF